MINFANQAIRLGIDWGSVTVKVAVLDSADRLLYESYQRHHGQPVATLRKILGKLRGEFHDNQPCAAAVTGSGRGLLAAAIDIPAVNEIVAHATATVAEHPHAKTIIEIGGQDSKLVRLGNNSSPFCPDIREQAMNDICAAGTGAFIEQQSQRMGIRVEDFGRLAIQSQSPATVTGRCSVFAKTDIVHLRQEGVPNQDIAAGLCNAVVRNYLAQFAKGRKLESPIVFQGGLAANSGVVKAFRQALVLDEKDLVVPKNFKIMGAVGCALLVQRSANSRPRTLSEIIGSVDRLSEQCESRHSALPRLSRSIVCKMNGKPRLADRPKPRGVVIGIDVGSTSTGVAITDREATLLAKSYVLNN
ncbi:MAG: hypothetical protein JXM70_08295, partial [Pirellulales bacterium]|nr:hypothetical protein [Pirellulales bacterium]